MRESLVLWMLILC